MIHKIITDKNYKKSLKIYAEENGFTQDFTLDELIKDSDFFTYNCEGIWKVQDREKLVTELDDTKDIRMQLKASNVTSVEVIKALLAERKSLLAEINDLRDENFEEEA